MFLAQHVIEENGLFQAAVSVLWDMRGEPQEPFGRVGVGRMGGFL